MLIITRIPITSPDCTPTMKVRPDIKALSYTGALSLIEPGDLLPGELPLDCELTTCAGLLTCTLHLQRATYVYIICDRPSVTVPESNTHIEP